MKRLRGPLVASAYSLVAVLDTQHPRSRPAVQALREVSQDTSFFR